MTLSGPGTVNANILPLPTSLSTHIFPPINSTNSFDIASPSPDPCRVSPPSRTWYSRSNTRFRLSAGISAPCGAGHGYV
jgi:hypothetical protein